MTERIHFLPRSADNDYAGHRVALFIFGLVLLLKTGISLGSIFNGHAAASSADGIPIDTYGAAGARTVVALFGLIGIANLAVCLIGIVVLVRYRSLVPFMFVVLLLQQLSRYVVIYFHPVVRTGAPPGVAINMVILGTMVVGLVLAIWPRNGRLPSAIRPGPTV
jgi:hypothetical protein